MTGPSCGRPWTEEDTATLRPYALTQGRTSSRAGLGRDSLVTANPGVRPGRNLQPEHSGLLALCQSLPVPVAELSGRLHLPVQTVKILVGDLLDIRLLVQIDAGPPSATSVLDVHLLERVREGLDRL
ncbi:MULTISPECIES: DUF742 domain-containing protein [unclassified Streptomyces]|uniref:DUF742 domain-containing protein n=1 Tax=unclassified Streptomyces TaxID=2593676 RepID=UPI00380E9EBF